MWGINGAPGFLSAVKKDRTHGKAIKAPADREK
jgi:hypothetical protein